MTLSELTRELRARGVHLGLKGDALAIKAPPGALTDELVAALRLHKDRLIELLADAGTAAEALPAVDARPAGAPWGTSPSQRRMFFLDQLHDGSTTYNLPGAWRIRGALDADALARGLEAFCTRHELLRRVFEERDDGLYLVPHGHPMPLVRRDLSGADDVEAALLETLDAEAVEPFDLTEGPLARFTLFRLGPDDHVIYVVTHAAIWDGWSFDVMLRDLGVLYGAAERGSPATLPEITVDFGGFVAWATALQSSERVAGQTAWWRERLTGSPTSLPLPSDRPRLAELSDAGGRVYLEWSAAVRSAAADLARAEGTTVFMVLLAAWVATLARLSGRSDIVVTTPVRGRPRPELEPLMGVFTNTVFLRVSTEGNPSFRELLQRVSRVTLEAFDRQDAPADDVLAELDESGDLRRSSLYQAMFSYQNTTERAADFDGLPLTFVQQDIHAVYSDLNFWVKDSGVAILGALDYRSTLYHRESAARVVDQLRTLLEHGLAEPNRAVGDLSLGPPARVADWPGAGAGAGAGVRAERAEPAEGAEAAEGAPCAVRGRLEAAGVGPGSVVVVRLGDWAAALAAARAAVELGAGVAFSHTGEAAGREQHLADVVGATHRLDDAGGEVAVVALEAPAAARGRAGIAWIDHSASPRPRPRRLGRRDVDTAALALAPVMAPAAGADVWTDLPPHRADGYVVAEAIRLGGARVRFPAVPAGAGPWRRAFDLADAGAPLAVADASLWNALATLGGLPGPTLRRAVVARGQLTRAAEAAFQAAGTEVVYLFDPGLAAPGALVAAPAAEGETAAWWALRGRRVEVVTAAGEGAATGVVGRLRVDGTDTAWRARVVADGRVAVLERDDGRVATSAGAIDPGDVETALGALEGIGASVVRITARPDGSPRVVAFVEVAPGAPEPTPTAVRRRVCALLPAGALPGVVQIGPLPRAADGSVARDRIDDAWRRAADRVQERGTPSTEREVAVAGVFGRLLGLDRLSLNDSFFELGGNSLMALQAVRLLQDDHGIRVSPRLLFYHSVRQIAAGQEATP